jgi:hypothetical protein
VGQSAKNLAINLDRHSNKLGNNKLGQALIKPCALYLTDGTSRFYCEQNNLISSISLKNWRVVGRFLTNSFYQTILIIPLYDYGNTSLLV